MGRGGLSPFFSSPLIPLCGVGSNVYCLYVSDKSPWRKKTDVGFFCSPIPSAVTALVHLNYKLLSLKAVAMVISSSDLK